MPRVRGHARPGPHDLERFQPQRIRSNHAATAREVPAAGRHGASENVLCCGQVLCQVLCRATLVYAVSLCSREELKKINIILVFLSGRWAPWAQRGGGKTRTRTRIRIRKGRGRRRRKKKSQTTFSATACQLFSHTLTRPITQSAPPGVSETIVPDWVDCGWPWALLAFGRGYLPSGGWLPRLR